jgi:cysteinyl-tRNA synthetase
MVKITPTTVMAVVVVILLGLAMQFSMRAKYYSGIADSHSAQLELQAVELDEAKSIADSIQLRLDSLESDYWKELEYRESQLDSLVSGREEARSALEATTETLRASLADSAQVQLDEVVEGYEFQIASLETSLEVQREISASQALRSQTQNTMIVSLRNVVIEYEDKTRVQQLEIEALRSSMTPSFGLRIKADWWLAVAGLGAGYALWGE